MNKKLIVFIVLTLAVFIVTFSNCSAQMKYSVGGGAMITTTGLAFSGIANAGYESGNVSTVVDLRSAPARVPAWLGLTTGYNIVKGDNPIKIYAGYWRRFTGNKNKEDRYVQNGQTTVLSSRKEIDTNGWDFGGGLQLTLVDHVLLDISYVRQINIGILFTGSLK